MSSEITPHASGDRLQSKHEHALQSGVCIRCRKLRGADGTKYYCRSCADLNAQHARESRKHNHEVGLCPKHGTLALRLKHCHVCRPETISSTESPIKLKQCIWCDQCSGYHHEGAYDRRPKQTRNRRGLIEGPNGSLIDFDKRKSDDVRQILTLCGKCRAEGSTEWRYRRDSEWNGLCFAHAHPTRKPRRDPATYNTVSYPTDDVELPNGSTIQWSKREGRKVPATCHCGKKVVSAIPQQRRAGWQCHDCATGKKTGDETHDSGTIIHWDVRYPQDRRRVLITCHRCTADSFIRDSTVRAENWNGLCSACIRRFGMPHPRKKYEDQPLPSGSVILWSKRDEWRRDRRLLEILVRCGFLDTSGRRCGKENFFSRQNDKTLTRLLGYCPTHTLRKIALAPHGEFQKGNGQKNGEAERRSTHGGARNVKWTPEKKGEFLTQYEEVLSLIKSKDSNLPVELLAKAELRGNKPSDVACEYTAQLLQVPANDYLFTVLKQARKARRDKTGDIQDRS